MTARQLALSALLEFHFQDRNLADFFASCGEGDERERRQAKEMAYGTLKHSLKLGVLLERLNQHKPLKIKIALRWIAKLALYQHLHMASIPLYAIVDESVALAKDYSAFQAKFLNALLRKLPETDLTTSLRDPGLEYSLPPFILEKLPRDEVLYRALLDRPQVMMRFNQPIKEEGLKPIASFEACSVYELIQSDQLLDFLKLEGAYVQNITPIRLMMGLYEPGFQPKSILDLCASPGGKLSLAARLYPQAQLIGNDISALRLKRLQENFARLKIKASFTECDGRAYPLDHLFDLIILDVPCSNSGVLHKKPEAKYRLDALEFHRLIDLQRALLLRAKALLSSQGQIWLMTCSVIQEENEGLLHFAEEHGLKLRGAPLNMIPSLNGGEDGGFGMCLESA
ncbi:MAG: methyltransferase domain-containing protein [Simkaniaceae bacterium]|nr:methyltransferase domain-containing protein [Simkaniaceae bacterium]MCF7852409.1 methyltransferase domain-containing protein [Simkaniaceae bacterium]